MSTTSGTGEEVVHVDGLGDVVGRPGVEAVAVARHGLRGQRDHRQVAEGGDPADLAHRGVAVHPRHHHVHQDQVDVRCCCSASMPASPLSAYTTSMPWPSRALASANTLRASSSTMRMRFALEQVAAGVALGGGGLLGDLDVGAVQEEGDLVDQAAHRRRVLHHHGLGARRQAGLVAPVQLRAGAHDDRNPCRALRERIHLIRSKQLPPASLRSTTTQSNRRVSSAVVASLDADQVQVDVRDRAEQRHDGRGLLDRLAGDHEQDRVFRRCRRRARPGPPRGSLASPAPRRSAARRPAGRRGRRRRRGRSAPRPWGRAVSGSDLPCSSEVPSRAVRSIPTTMPAGRCCRAAATASVARATATTLNPRARPRSTAARRRWRRVSATRSTWSSRPISSFGRAVDLLDLGRLHRAEGRHGVGPHGMLRVVRSGLERGAPV